ncbi:MAG: hypothetical protein WCS85_03175 [Candidatus Peribacteraceae bacterium]
MLRSPGKDHELRVAQWGRLLVITYFIAKKLDATLRVEVPERITLEDIEQAWNVRHDWHEIYVRDKRIGGKGLFEALRTLDMPWRNCRIVWVLRHRDDITADICFGFDGEPTDQEFEWMFFENPPVVEEAAPIDSAAPAPASATSAAPVESDAQPQGTS